MLIRVHTATVDWGGTGADDIMKVFIFFAVVFASMEAFVVHKDCSLMCGAHIMAIAASSLFAIVSMV